MSKFIYFTPEEKARAQNTDLVSLLRAQGERPVRSGREFRTPNDPSITVRGNKWFDHSARVGGYAVSFVQRYYRLPYQEAVLLLLGRKNRKTYEQAKPVNEVPKAFALPEPYGTMRRMYAYLMRQRHIDREVISYFVHERLLYEDKHHNCVFVGLDDSGEAKHAHIRSTNSEGRVFRMNIESSASEHCFHKNGMPQKYLEYLTNFTAAPILYVHGNHDGSYRENEPGGCICVDDSVYVWKGLRIMGLGGSIRYNNREDSFQYTEREMRRRVRKLWRKAHHVGGIDLLLTHSPAAGLNDSTDHAHKGFACFNDLMDEYEPQWFVHGHVHLNYDAKLPRVCTRGKTTVINATERYVFEIPDPDPVIQHHPIWKRWFDVK